MSRWSAKVAALACLLLLGLAWAVGGCGVKGPPKPPERPIIRGF